MNFVSEPDYPKHDPIWRCNACNTIWVGEPHICKVVNKNTVGVRFSLTSARIGVHYSKTNRRACINLVPFVTVWIALKGGRRP